MVEPGIKVDEPFRDCFTQHGKMAMGLLPADMNMTFIINFKVTR